MSSSEGPHPHRIEDHAGIVGVEPSSDGTTVQIAYDPKKLSQEDIRRIVKAHIKPVLNGSMKRCVLRLDGEACEAAAAKLERRVEKIPGVRHAMASYVGRVLCLTFDSGVSDEEAVLERVRSAGARIKPLEKKVPVRRSVWGRVRAGELNEEISCAVGFLFLVASGAWDHFVGRTGLVAFLYLGAYVFCGQQGVRSAIASLRERTLDIDVLMVLAALGAAVVGSPFEGALLLFLFSFSNVLQRHALERTQRAIESLLTLRPDKALRKRDGTTELVPIESLVPGDVVIVRPGELIPADGLVAEGRSHVDESSLTGESMPVSKVPGNGVFAGTLNQSGSIEVRVTKPVEDSALSRMVRLVAEAQAEKSRTQRFLEKAEQRYAAGVIAFTILVLCVPWLGWGEGFTESFYRAMTVMVVASPCALIISTPATVLSAIGGAARQGVLIKGGSHLETAARVNIVCLDKTGTLTVGKPAVTDIVTARGRETLNGDLSSEATQYLKIAAALEARSEHPLATAIVNAARKENIPIQEARAFQAFTGRGAEAEVGDVRYVMGSGRFLAELHAEGMPALESFSEELQKTGKTCVWLGRRQGETVSALAVFALADTLRPEARSVVENLRQRGVKKVVMLTGDQEPVARAIAAEAGIDELHAGLLPDGKVKVIRQLKKEGTVLMVGDGVNDAPALASAHLGAAMGAAGTDIAMETADIVLMGDKLENIPLLVGMARHARRVLIQNLTFASVVIVTLVTAALGFDLPLPVGVVGHEGSTVLVCLNGLRLLAYRPTKPAAKI